ncbi:unnamed protein product [marine sediment metagenome]|uniref:Uncharacterized protein n=1 Tax=marine sediment metagenome TaxID=412755 RepID=X1QI85_9ZZZZ
MKGMFGKGVKKAGSKKWEEMALFNLFHTQHSLGALLWKALRG